MRRHQKASLVVEEKAKQPIKQPFSDVRGNSFSGKHDSLHTLINCVHKSEIYSKTHKHDEMQLT